MARSSEFSGRKPVHVPLPATQTVFTTAAKLTSLWARIRMTQMAICRCSIYSLSHQQSLPQLLYLPHFRNQKISSIADCTRKHTDLPLFQDEASFSSAHHQCKEDIPCKMAAMWLFVLLHKLSRLEAAVQLVLTALFDETKYVFRETNQRMTAGYVIPRNWPLALQIPGKMSS